MHCIKLNLNLKEFQESNIYFKTYQVNKIEYFDELYYNLNLHSNLNIKLEFKENSHMNVIEFFSMSCHIESYHNPEYKP